MSTLEPDLSARPFELAVERRLNAQPDDIYDAWTRRYDTWFAAPGTLQMDAREGGLFFFETHFDGGRHPHYGRFLELRENELMRMTWMNGNPGTLGAETVVTVELAPQDGGTLVRLMHAGFYDEASRDRHEEAWPLVLEHLDQHLAEIQSEQ